MDVEFLDGSWMLSTLLLAPLRVKRIYPFKSLENWRNCCSTGKRGGVTRYLRCHYDCSAKINYSKASNCASTLSDNTKVTSRVANDHVYAECSLKIDEKPLWGKKEPSATKENSSTKLSNHGLNTVDICRIILFIEREEKSSDWWRVEKALCGKEKKIVAWMILSATDGRSRRKLLRELTSRAFFLNQPSIIPRTMYRRD